MIGYRLDLHLVSLPPDSPDTETLMMSQTVVLTVGVGNEGTLPLGRGQPPVLGSGNDRLVGY